MAILVTGARGTVGRRVIDDLVAVGVVVRAVSRRPDDAHLPAEVSVSPGDLADPDTLAPALDGVDRVFLYAEPQGIEGFVARAEQAGVEHVVLLSSAAAEAAEDADSFLVRRHVLVEEALRASSLPWTFLRPGAFATNTLQWAPSIKADGVVRAPYGRAHQAPIHEGDIAAVAVTALTEAGHHGRVYTLSGPESITQVRQAELIGEAIGRTVRFEEQSPDEARAQLLQAVPEPVVDALLALRARAVDRPQAVTTTVEDVTGRPARSFATWAADHVDAFR